MKKLLLIGAVIIGFCGLSWGLSQTRPDQDYLKIQQFKLLFPLVLSQVQAQKPQARILVDTQLMPTILEPEIKKMLQKWQAEHSQLAGAVVPDLSLKLRWETPSTHQDQLIAESNAGRFEARRARIHWTSALPPLIAVALALITQRLILSLFLGILAGSIFAADWNPLLGFVELFSKHGWAAISDFFHLKILLFAGFLLGMVGIMNVSGGTRGIIEALQHYVKSRRSTQLMTWVMGLLVFFDDYANSFVIGTTMRPVTDRLKISREKLAYIVDSTAAPVSGIAIISTWIGYEVGLFQDALDQIQAVNLGGYQAFIQALPFRFYCILSLTMVLLVVWLKRDLGAMYHAEIRAIEQGLVLREGATPLTSKTFNGLDAKPGIPLRWQNAALPILAVILATLAGLYISGGGLNLPAGGWRQLFTIQHLGAVFSSADSGTVLLWSSIAGCATAVVLVLSQRLLSLKEVSMAWGKGVSSILIASVILVLAWALNSVAAEIGTAPYLIAIFRDSVQPLWLPLLIFILSGAVAFSTGSSWSTMAILIPVAVPLAYEMGGATLMLIAMGAVLDGSIFGDHCSPLSDTTILSSIACSCDHLDHVKTQFPYAIITMFVAALVCYLPASAGWSPFPLIVLAVLALAGILLIFGRDPEVNAQYPPAPTNHLQATEPLRYSQES